MRSIRQEVAGGRRVELVMTRQDCAAMVVGGPTTVLDLGGLRVVSDPTFDPPVLMATSPRLPARQYPTTSSGRWTWCW